MNKRLKTSEIIKKLKITRQALNLWVKDGCPHKKRGRVFYFDLDEVQQWRGSRALETKQPIKADGYTDIAREKYNKKKLEKEQLVKETVPEILNIDAKDLAGDIKKIASVTMTIIKEIEAQAEIDPARAIKYIEVYGKIIDCKAKTIKSDLDIRKTTSDLIEMDSAEGFVRTLCGLFKSKLNEIKALANEIVLSILKGLNFTLEPVSFASAEAIVKTFLETKFNAALDSLSEEFLKLKKDILKGERT